MLTLVCHMKRNRKHVIVLDYNNNNNINNLMEGFKLKLGRIVEQ